MCYDKFNSPNKNKNKDKAKGDAAALGPPLFQKVTQKKAKAARSTAELSDDDEIVVAQAPSTSRAKINQPYAIKQSEKKAGLKEDSTLAKFWPKPPTTSGRAGALRWSQNLKPITARPSRSLPPWTMPLQRTIPMIGRMRLPQRRQCFAVLAGRSVVVLPPTKSSCFVLQPARRRMQRWTEQCRCWARRRVRMKSHPLAGRFLGRKRRMQG